MVFMCNRVVINSLIFHANNLVNFPNKRLPVFMDYISVRVREPQRTAVDNFIKEIQKEDLSTQERVDLKDRLITVLEVAPLESLGNFSALASFAHDFIPSCFSFLDTKEISRAASVNMLFHKSSLLAYTEQFTHPNPSLSYSGLVNANSHIFNFDYYLKLLELIPTEKFGLISSLDLSGYGGNDAEFGKIIAHFPALTSIDLTEADDLTVASITALAAACPHLTDIKLSSCLRMEYTAAINILSQRYPRLRRIDLSESKWRTEIEDDDLDTLTRSCRELTHINLNYGKSFTNNGLRHIGTRCPNLEVLNLYCCTGINHEGILHIAQGCPKLNSIECCFDDGDKTMEVIAAHCRSLTHLRMVKCLVTNNGIDALVSTRPEDLDLKTIDLGYNRSIRSDAIFRLLDRFPNLETLGLEKIITIAPIKICRMLRKYPHIHFSAEDFIKFKRELEYAPSSSLGKFYQAVFKQEPISTSITDERLLEQIYYQVWELSGEKNEADWGRLHVFDDLEILLMAIRRALKVRVDDLSPEQKNCLYGKVYRLAGSPKTLDRKWGEKHAFENYTLLADALASLKE